MSSSETDICNSALVKIGAQRIISLDDDSEAARICKEQYPKVRDALLRSHPWNFCIERLEIAADVTTPVYGFDYRFALPSDSLRVLDVDSNDMDWAREGQYILTDSSTLKIRHIKKVTTTGSYDATFAEALAARLAYDISYSFVQSVTLKEALMKEAEHALRTARSFDAQEGTPQRVVANDWFTERY